MHTTIKTVVFSSEKSSTVFTQL